MKSLYSATAVRAASLFAIALAVMGSGCGGDDEGGPEKAFRDEADAICKEARSRTSREFEEVLNEGSGSVVTEVVVPSLRGQIRDLQALNPPAGMEDAASALVRELEKVLQAAESDPGGFERAAEPLVTKSEKTARSYGFAQCGGYAGRPYQHI